MDIKEDEMIGETEKAEDVLHALIPEEELYKKLYAHQQEGISFLYDAYQNGKSKMISRSGAILADEMGLGKSIQVILFLHGMIMNKQEFKNAMLVVPFTLMYDWKEKLKQWTPKMNISIYHSQVTDQSSNLKNLQRTGGILLVSYNTFLNHFKKLTSYNGNPFHWDCLIFDEAHKLKNTNSKRHKVAAKISVTFCILITGTPMQNNLREFWSLFSLISSTCLLGTYKTFRANFENPITKGMHADATAEEKALGIELQEILKKLTEQFCLRRRIDEIQAPKRQALGENMPSEQVLQLPKKDEYVVWIKLSNEQEDAYHRIATESCTFDVIHSLLTICTHPRLNSELKQLKIDGSHLSESGKLVFLLSLLKTLSANGHFILVFSNYIKHLDIIELALTQSTWGQKAFLRIDGQCIKDRQKIITQFQKRKSQNILLLSTEVGAEGLTLTAADCVVFADISWNPCQDAQAVGRAHRIGQTRNVRTFRLITCGTLEERMYRRQLFRSSLTRQVVGDDSNPLRHFTENELKSIMMLQETQFSLTQQQLMKQGAKCLDVSKIFGDEVSSLCTASVTGISDHGQLLSASQGDDLEVNMAKLHITETVKMCQQAIETESHLRTETCFNVSFKKHDTKRKIHSKSFHLKTPGLPRKYKKKYSFAPVSGKSKRKRKRFISVPCVSSDRSNLSTNDQVNLCENSVAHISASGKNDSIDYVSSTTYKEDNNNNNSVELSHVFASDGDKNRDSQKPFFTCEQIRCLEMSSYSMGDSPQIESGLNLPATPTKSHMEVVLSFENQDLHLSNIGSEDSFKHGLILKHMTPQQLFNSLPHTPCPKKEKHVVSHNETTHSFDFYQSTPLRSIQTTDKETSVASINQSVYNFLPECKTPKGKQTGSECLKRSKKSTPGLPRKYKCLSSSLLKSGKRKNYLCLQGNDSNNSLCQVRRVLMDSNGVQVTPRPDKEEGKIAITKKRKEIRSFNNSDHYNMTCNENLNQESKVSLTPQNQRKENQVRLCDYSLTPGAISPCYVPQTEKPKQACTYPRQCCIRKDTEGQTTEKCSPNADNEANEMQIKVTKCLLDLLASLSSKGRSVRKTLRKIGLPKKGLKKKRFGSLKSKRSNCSLSYRKLPQKNLRTKENVDMDTILCGKHVQKLNVHSQEGHLRECENVGTGSSECTKKFLFTQDNQKSTCLENENSCMSSKDGECDMAKGVQKCSDPLNSISEEELTGSMKAARADANVIYSLWPDSCLDIKEKAQYSVEDGLYTSFIKLDQSALTVGLNNHLQDCSGTNPTDISEKEDHTFYHTSQYKLLPLEHIRPSLILGEHDQLSPNMYNATSFNIQMSPKSTGQLNEQASSFPCNTRAQSFEIRDSGQSFDLGSFTDILSLIENVDFDGQTFIPVDLMEENSVVDQTTEDKKLSFVDNTHENMRGVCQSNETYQSSIQDHVDIDVNKNMNEIFQLLQDLKRL